jgi:hypothetical protein
MNNHGINFDISDVKKPHFGESKDDQVTLVWWHKKINLQSPSFAFPYISLTVSCF